MVAYPISTPPDGYRGNNSKKLEKLRNDVDMAHILEAYVNSEFVEMMGLGYKVAVFHYTKIANETGIGLETVRRLMFRLDCGSNGVTVYAPGYDPAES